MACLCVFAGAASGDTTDFTQKAYELAGALSASGHSFIYGGGQTGLMGAFANGVIAKGGHIEGVIPEFLSDREVAHEGVAKMTVTETMHERKMLMYKPADGFLILPGGLGTLDETMEVLTWRQLGLHSKPLIILNVAGYWDPLLKLAEHFIAEEFADPSLRDFYTVQTTATRVLAYLATLRAENPDQL